MRNIAIAFLAVFLFNSAIAEEKELQLPDLVGNQHTPLTATDKAATVIAFVSPYCPTSNTLMKELSRISQDHADKITFYFIHADPAIKEADVLQHTEMFSIKEPVLLDKDQTLAKQLQITVTPEIVVIGKDKAILYQGRVNDLYLTPTRKQRQPTTQDLRDVLAAVLSGKTIPVSRTEAIGCKLTLP